MSWPRSAEPRRLGVAVAMAAAIVLAGCSGDGGSAGACAPVERIIEPGSIHVLPGVDVVYQYSPPTSGAHLVPAPESGVIREPIPEPRQVAAVEQGHVILQYSAAVSAADIEALEALASDDGVLVAPGVGDFDTGADFAFTAWSKRQLCTELDLVAAAAFIDDHLGVFFTDHP